MSRSQDPSEPQNVCQVQRAGVIKVSAELCLACRECELVCSLFHEGECNPELSRIRIDFDDFQPGLPDIRVCKQCEWPACYFACAAHRGEQAIRVDERTGARFVDERSCQRCGICVRACPLTPERTVLFQVGTGRGRRHFMCDLCKERPEGPLCVEICPGGALAYVPAEKRGR